MFAEFNRTKVPLIHPVINTYIHTDEANIKRVRMGTSVILDKIIEVVKRNFKNRI